MRSMGLGLTVVLVVALASRAFSDTSLETNSRDKRFLSLFSVVQFKNNECTATSGLTGVCYSSTDCSDLGGTTSGNCAAGFGVCCIISVAACGGTVSYNATYIQNTNYPSTITSTANSCAYTVNYCNTNICQLRLDFENLVLAVTNGAVTTDYVAVAGPTDQDPPAIAGTNTGYHMYVETARSTTATTITVTTSSSTSTAQSWQIKVSQIECDSTSKAPEGCTQFFTSDSGTIYSYGYPNELDSQENTICIRSNANKCKVDYTVAGGTSPDPFEIGGTIAAAETNGCITAAVHVSNSCQGNAGSGYVCQEEFACVDADTISGVITSVGAPFMVTHTSETGVTTTTGFKLNYVQVGC